MDLVEQIAARGVSAVLEDSDDTDALLEALLAWLSGDRLSDRADEHELRVQAAWEAREYFDGLDVFDRFTALAILALPPDHDDRDLDTAQQLLEGHLAASRDAGEDGEELRTIADLLDHELVDEARAGELLERGSALVDPDDASGAERFALEAQSYCVRRFIAARDAGDAGAARGWLERAETYRAWPEDPADDDPSAVLSLAEQLDIAEQWPEAAEAYGRVVRVSDPDDASVQHFAVRVGELRLLAGDPAAAAAAIEDMLPAIERRYVTALRDEDVAAAAELLAAAVDGLAVAHARLEDWSAVCRTLDRTRGLRLRRRRALREAENGAALLDLERRLHAAQRRVADSPPPAELLEAYRRLLPEEDLVPAGPDGDALAARLPPREAAVFVAHHFAGTVAAVAARTGDGPAVTRHPPRATSGRTSGSPPSRATMMTTTTARSPSTSTRMVAAADELVGVPLGALLAELGVRRATVLAEDMLNLVPWWAVPSLDGLQVMTAGSAGELLDRQDAPPDAAPRTGLLVANPTARPARDRARMPRRRGRAADGRLHHRAAPGRRRHRGRGGRRACAAAPSSTSAVTDARTPTTRPWSCIPIRRPRPTRSPPGPTGSRRGGSPPATSIPRWPRSRGRGSIAGPTSRARAGCTSVTGTAATASTAGSSAPRGRSRRPTGARRASG